MEARLDRQILDLEAADVSAEFRRRVAVRVTNLEHDLGQRQATLRKLRSEIDAFLAPDPAVIDYLLGSMPILAEDLPELPQPELRALLDSLDLGCVYDPSTRMVDLTITLVGGRGDRSQVWDVRSAFHNPNTPPPATPLVSGPVIRLPGHHGKVRRDGYCASRS